jgi:spore maturation protein CgeB
LTGDNRSLLLVGDGREEHVGSHFVHAARESGLTLHFLDTREAQGGWLARKISWNLMKRRPSGLSAFSRRVVEHCSQHEPGMLLTTGFAPVTESSLKRIGDMGVYRVNYLTDDPWNRDQYAPWFLRAVKNYDEVLSTRRANIEDLRALGCGRVGYLPFGFAPHLHFPENATPERLRELASDVVFAGGADRDRIPYMAALASAGFDVGLYGAYWERFPETRALARGYKSLAFVREAVAAAKVALCLVRRANRDGVCMRTFEVPAIGACMLVEKTEEHVELFGPEGHAVIYFDNIPEMIEKTRWLLANEGERQRLKDAAHRLITGGNHTYRHRLLSILECAGAARAA